MNERYDIYYLSPVPDARTAQVLAESIRRYRLPSGVKLPDPGLGYQRTMLDLSGKPIDDALRQALDMTARPTTRSSPYRAASTNSR